mmetsp:Transcript_4007/g.10481  ORF Transcript_4007/g.10481 Transcript_4007/m.10481 type:complete len:202 (+) Transcript_4007:2158-2763(+)
MVRMSFGFGLRQLTTLVMLELALTSSNRPLRVIESYETQPGICSGILPISFRKERKVPQLSPTMNCLPSISGCWVGLVLLSKRLMKLWTHLNSSERPKSSCDLRPLRCRISIWMWPRIVYIFLLPTISEEEVAKLCCRLLLRDLRRQSLPFCRTWQRISGKICRIINPLKAYSRVGGQLILQNLRNMTPRSGIWYEWCVTM